jgi:hypothetical protein
MQPTFAQPAFQKASPLREIREASDLELRGKASASEIQLLYANPLLWLRALQQLRRAVQNHMAKDRKNLAELKPTINTHASEEYLEAKAAVDRRSQGRLHVDSLAQRRIEEVKALLGPSPLSQLMAGDLIDVLSDIAQLADGGELEDAADKAWHWAKRR